MRSLGEKMVGDKASKGANILEKCSRITRWMWVSIKVLKNKVQFSLEIIASAYNL